MLSQNSAIKSFSDECLTSFVFDYQQGINNLFSIIFLQSIWQSFPGQKNNWERPGQTICNESSEEGLDRPEDKDYRAHKDREASFGGHQAGPVPGAPALCLPDRGQAASDSR